MSGAPLRCRALSARLGGATVVDGVTLEFAAGAWVAVVGPNGAGKSTLLSLLAGLRRPDAGQVWLDDQPLETVPARRRAQRLAWLSQHGEAEGGIAVRDVVRLGRLPRHGLLGAPDAADEAAVGAALAETACSALAQRRLDEISGGERQRVLLARVLAVQAPVLLLDEPVTHLDAPHQSALCAGLRRRVRDGATVVTVLHDLTLALAADRVLVLQRGRLAADGAPADPALRGAIESAFDHALAILPVPTPAGDRWVAVPEV